MDGPWNRCDVCGQFIAMEDFGKGAVRRLVTPDSHLSREEYETLCIAHANDDEAKAIARAAIDLMASNENTDVLALQLAAVRGAVREI
jgi:hypothetical protein